MSDPAEIQTLTCLRDLYKAAFACNHSAPCFVVGTKSNLDYGLPGAQKIEMAAKVKKFAQAIEAPLIYCANTETIRIDITKLSQIVIGAVFHLKPKVEIVDDPMKPAFSEGRELSKPTSLAISTSLGVEDNVFSEP
jgi:GTP-binding protein of the ras superfamily involved in termination of M-phase